VPLGWERGSGKGTAEENTSGRGQKKISPIQSNKKKRLWLPSPAQEKAVNWERSQKKRTGKNHKCHFPVLKQGKGKKRHDSIKNSREGQARGSCLALGRGGGQLAPKGNGKTHKAAPLRKEAPSPLAPAVKK